MARRYTDEQIIGALEQAGTQHGAAALLGLDARGYERRIKSIREAMIDEGVERWVATLMYTAVRLFGWIGY